MVACGYGTLTMHLPKGEHQNQGQRRLTGSLNQNSENAHAYEGSLSKYTETLNYRNAAEHVGRYPARGNKATFIWV